MVVVTKGQNGYEWKKEKGNTQNNIKGRWFMVKVKTGVWLKKIEKEKRVEKETVISIEIEKPEEKKCDRNSSKNKKRRSKNIR